MTSDDARRAVTADAVALAVDLVRVPSENPALVPGAAGEAAVARRLAERLSRNGFEVEVVAPPDSADRPSLLATHRGGGGGRSLLLNGHLDTVGAAGMVDPFAGRVDGDRLLGRGACDMKGGVAAMVVAAERAASAGTAGDVVLALVADEEHASVGTETVLATLVSRDALPDACVVGEPTWCDLAVAHRGYAVVEVVFAGRAAHTSQPELGTNAVAHLGRFLGAIESADAGLRRVSPHPLLGHGSLAATVASGGTSPFVVPDSALVVVERRTLPGEPSSAGLDDVERVLAALHAGDDRVDASARVVLAREAWELDDDDTVARDLVDTLGDALAATGRAVPQRIGVPYWMESALWGAAGVPTVVCGPAGGGLHADDEWVDLGQVRACALAYADTIAAFCGT